MFCIMQNQIIEYVISLSLSETALKLTLLTCMCNTYYLQQLLFMIYLSNVQATALYKGVFTFKISSLLIRKTIDDYGPLHSYNICHECSYHRMQWLCGSKGA